MPTVALLVPVLEVNLRSQISMVRAFLPHLLDRREAHISNVASLLG